MAVKKKTVQTRTKKTTSKKKSSPAVRSNKKKPTKKKPTGRPRYKPSKQHIETAYKGAKKGLNEEEIAKAIGISYACFQKYKKDFVGAIKKGHNESDDANVEKVENSLLRRANGYNLIETTTERKKMRGGKYKMFITKTVTKHLPPSETSMMFYLVNRKADRWQSINRPSSEREGSFGEIQKWFQAMEKEYEGMTGDAKSK